MHVHEVKVAGGEAVNSDDREGGQGGHVARPLLAGAHITVTEEDEERNNWPDREECVEDTNLVIRRK